jgi:hypothetical protein
MIPRRAPLGWSLAMVLTVGATAHCGSRTVDAVDLGQSPDGGRPPAAALGQSADGGPPPAVALGQPPDGGPPLIWPTPSHGANSDPWLVENHDSLLEMRPRVVVLDFYNYLDAQAAQKRVQATIDAIAESSRYHGYSDPTAPAFLNYALVKIVDLTDHPPPPGSTLESSTLLPTDLTGAFDASALFMPAFAAHYGFSDPADPSQALTLCQLFESGTINELWLMTGDEGSSRRPPLMAELKQVYDATNKAMPGSFADTGYQPQMPPLPRCGVTMRIAYVSPITGVDCDLVPRSLGIENTALASRPVIPYLTDNARDFFNGEFKSLDGATFDSWAQLIATGPGGWCSETMPCISYPSERPMPASVPIASGTFPDGSTWTMSPFHQGCGGAHFPSNARFMWDYANTQAVRSRCEHYALHDASGDDALVGYSSDLASVSAYAQQFGDSGCGPGWQIYLRQSMPGLHNPARATDGSPMKNWWPFLFY